MGRKTEEEKARLFFTTEEVKNPKTGERYYIFPSSGWNGIDAGIVEVIGVPSRNTALKVYRTYDLTTYDIEARQHGEYEYYPTHYVAYRYTMLGGVTPNNDLPLEEGVLPLDIFLEHTERIE